MNERINDKIEEIENYLVDLESYVPVSFDDYISDKKTKDACEHCFEKIVGAMIDLAFIVIKEKNLKGAQEDIRAFFVLAENNMITKELAERLSDAKRMRNIIAHEYGKVDDELVFDAIKEELPNDALAFVEAVRRIK